MKILLSNIFLSLLFLFLLSKNLYTQDLTPEQIYQNVNDCIVVILSYDFDGKLAKQGSGVVINDKGWVVTNYHFFAECEKMEIKHKDHLIQYPDIIGLNAEKDILILKIYENTFPSIPIANVDDLKIDQRVYTVGSLLNLENSMSEGIVNGLKNTDARNIDYIQITASISPESSGGAVLNSRGELIGISTLTFKDGQNLIFAIPMNDILKVSLDLNTSKNQIDSNNYYHKGLNAIKSGNFSEGIDHLTNYLNIFPNGAITYIKRGIAYAKMKEHSKAISDFSKSIEINPNYLAYYNRGLSYAYGLGNNSKAIEDYNKAIELNPNDPEVYNNRGLAYAFGFFEYSKAIEDYNKAIELNPKYADAYFNRGISYFYSILIDNMCDDMRKAYSLGIKQAAEYLINHCK